MKLGIRVVERISLDVHLRIIKITNIPDMTPRTSVNRCRRFGRAASHSGRPETLGAQMSACEEFRTESSDAEIWSSCKLVVTSQAGTGAESLGEYFPTFRKVLVTPSSGSSRPKHGNVASK